MAVRFFADVLETASFSRWHLLDARYRASPYKFSTPGIPFPFRLTGLFRPVAIVNPSAIVPRYQGSRASNPGMAGRRPGAGCGVSVDGWGAAIGGACARLTRGKNHTGRSQRTNGRICGGLGDRSIRQGPRLARFARPCLRRRAPGRPRPLRRAYRSPRGCCNSKTTRARSPGRRGAREAAGCSDDPPGSPRRSRS